jgi:hypothetical protein
MVWGEGLMPSNYMEEATGPRGPVPVCGHSRKDNLFSALFKHYLVTLTDKRPLLEIVATQS